MKKILLSALVSTVVASAAFAEGSCAAFNGAYLGGGLNYMQEKFKVAGSTHTVRGGGVKLFGGYGAAVSQGLYLGGELTLGFDRLVGSKKNEDVESSKKFNYGIAGRVGYVVSSALPYVKFGYEGRPSAGSIRRNGFILGGGVDVAVAKNVFVRGEYVHGFGSKNNGFKTSSETFLLGAAYKF